MILPDLINHALCEINKKELSEIDICDLYITPAIINAGWDQLSQIRREVTLTPGPVIVRGNMSVRNKKKKKFADLLQVPCAFSSNGDAFASYNKVPTVGKMLGYVSQNYRWRTTRHA